MREPNAKPFRVHLGGRRFRRFATLDDARTFCNDVFYRTKIVLTIEKVV